AALGLSLPARRALANALDHRLDQLVIGREQTPARGRVGLLQRMREAGWCGQETVALELDVARALLGVGSQPRVLDRLARQDRDIFQCQVSDRVLGYAGVPIPDHPLLVKLSRLLARQ